MEKIIFKSLTLNDLLAYREYFEKCDYRICDYSVAFKLMWQRFDNISFALVENCLVFKYVLSGKTLFYYPMTLGDSGDEERALNAIERYCVSNKIPLSFAYVSREKMQLMTERYGSDMRVSYNRRWSDYLYNATDFVTYGGKRFSGQRNHVNKFKKNYPDFSFVTLGSADSGEIYAFLKKFEERQLAKNDLFASEELYGVYELLPHIDELNLLAGAIKLDGEIIAISIGERCADTLVISVEKALVEYDGIYQVMAQEFAKRFAVCGVKYINREDDAGDAGLRKSKLQYNPERLVCKYEVFPTRLIDGVENLPTIKSGRVTLKKIGEEDMQELYRLEYDCDRNKYWGYDWREHFKGEPTPEYFLKGVREDFEERQEMPLGIYLWDRLIGEVVLHNFGYGQECEVGIRVLAEYEGQGYAGEAVRAVTNYAIMELGAEVVNAKCMRENVRSAALFKAVGFRPNGEDDTYFYFKKTAAM
ncbi:MAG: GNAT family N-acetyltransferase [Candidatus Coproplasma sp.]